MCTLYNKGIIGRFKKLLEGGRWLNKILLKWNLAKLTIFEANFRILKYNFHYLNELLHALVQ
jgi:hypothetical protein